MSELDGALDSFVESLPSDPAVRAQMLRTASELLLRMAEDVDPVNQHIELEGGHRYLRAPHSADDRLVFNPDKEAVEVEGTDASILAALLMAGKPTTATDLTELIGPERLVLTYNRKGTRAVRTEPRASWSKPESYVRGRIGYMRERRWGLPIGVTIEKTTGIKGSKQPISLYEIKLAPQILPHGTPQASPEA